MWKWVRDLSRYPYHYGDISIEGTRGYLFLHLGSLPRSEVSLGPKGHAGGRGSEESKDQDNSQEGRHVFYLLLENRVL